jgi:hypothetical protein
VCSPLPASLAAIQNRIDWLPCKWALRTPLKVYGLATRKSKNVALIRNQLALLRRTPSEPAGRERRKSAKSVILVLLRPSSRRSR